MSKTVSVRLSDDVADAFQHEAEQRGVEPSEVLREAVTAFLEKTPGGVSMEQLRLDVLRTRALLRRFAQQMTDEKTADELVEESRLDVEEHLRKEGQS
jgi:hypothetical protein